MNIPTEFKLMGKTWRVKHNPLMLAQEHAYGRCEYASQEIFIHAEQNHDNHVREGIEHTFCHELLHAIAFTASVELDERDIDVMAGLLHQFMETREGSVR